DVRSVAVDALHVQLDEAVGFGQTGSAARDQPGQHPRPESSHGSHCHHGSEADLGARPMSAMHYTTYGAAPVSATACFQAPREPGSVKPRVAKPRDEDHHAFALAGALDLRGARVCAPVAFFLR